MTDEHMLQASESDYYRPVPNNSRYIPFTQQASCCVPTCIQMVMYRNDIPLRPAEEIGYHLGLVVAPDKSGLFCNVRAAVDAPPAGYGIQMHIPEYNPNAAFARMNIPLDFTKEPIANFSSAEELLERLRTHEQNDRDALFAFNLGALLDDPSLSGAHHACVFDRVLDGRVRLIDPSFHAPKWRTFDVEQLFFAMQKHISSDWGGIWLLTKTDARSKAH
jgi:hypothetical protein